MLAWWLDRMTQTSNSSTSHVESESSLQSPHLNSWYGQMVNAHWCPHSKTSLLHWVQFFYNACMKFSIFLLVIITMWCSCNRIAPKIFLTCLGSPFHSWSSLWRTYQFLSTAPNVIISFSSVNFWFHWYDGCYQGMGESAHVQFKCVTPL